MEEREKPAKPMETFFLDSQYMKKLNYKFMTKWALATVFYLAFAEALYV